MKGITPAALGAAMRGDMDNFMVAMIPGGIEAQEAQGQRDLVSSERLPKDINGYRFKGMDAKEVYALAGIEVVGEYDDIFLNVKLPTGWKLEPTDHSMWSKLLDEKGRERAAIFFKAAFYDRNADFSFTTRFRATVEPEDAYKTDVSYEEREKMPRYGRVYDGGKLVFQTEGRNPEPSTRKNWEKRDTQDQELISLAQNWLMENEYPEYEDPLKYWEL